MKTKIEDCRYCQGRGELLDWNITLPRLCSGARPTRRCPVCDGDGWYIVGEFEVGDERAEQDTV